MVAVDIVSDVMCPWCYIGKRRLEQARTLVPKLKLDIRWRPFQLDPTLPPGGKPRREYLEAKFGSVERARTIYERVEAAGREVDIDFRIDAIKVSPNTLDAHRLIRWSAAAGHEDEMVERLFELYFLEGANICDLEVLVGAAEAVGMDTAIVSDLLASDADAAEVREEINVATQLGISGVPAFIVDRKYLVSGAQPAEVLAQVFEQSANEADRQP